MRSFFKTFLTVFVPLVIVLLLSFYQIDKIIEKSFKQETLNEMRSKWTLLGEYNISDKFDIKTYEKLKQISKKTSLRITVIKRNGTVVYDSFLSPEEILKMENHKNRPEVKKARVDKLHEGYSIRFSNTLKIKMFYYARLLNEKLILRIAYPLTFINNFKNLYLNGVGKTFLYLIIASVLISFLLARTISSPLNQLENLSEQIEKGEENIIFPEFKDISLKRITKVIYKIYNSMKRQQADIIQEKEKAESIFEILEEGIILLSDNNIIKYFNKKAEEHLGMKLEKNKNIFMLDNLNYNILNFLEQLNKESGFYKKTFKNKIFEVYLKKLQNEKLFVFYDISKQIEYTEFKHQLIGNISHELKTPIATIMNYAETILDFDTLEREELKNFIAIIHRNAKRMDELIYDIIELHKLENIKLEEISEATDIREILSEIAAKFKTCEKNLIINCNVDKINMLTQHFQSMLENLTDNAIKYSSGKNVYVDIYKNNGITIKVSDEGPLIPENERERIFERFYTVSKSRNKENSGSGLGLSIVKHIAQIYKGRVKVYPNSFNGNTFEVKILL